MAAHFNHSLDDLKVMAIEKIHDNNTERRKLRERYWIFELRMLSLEGLNLDDCAAKFTLSETAVM